MKDEKLNILEVIQNVYKLQIIVPEACAGESTYRILARNCHN